MKLSASFSVRATLATVSALALGALLAAAPAQAQTPNAIDLGTLNSNGSPYNTTVSITSAAQVVWYKFSIGAVGGSTYLDLTTLPTSSTLRDTEIGLYNAAGALVATDDDDGMSLYSALSFGGAATRPADTALFTATTGVAFNNRDGATLAAGDYYLATALFNATFGATNFGVTTNSTIIDTFTLSLRTNVPVVVPEAGTVGLLATGLVSLLGTVALRRRSKHDAA